MAEARQKAGVRRPRNWRELFLDQLAQSSNVAAAARVAKVDVSTVYKARRSEAPFAAAWQDALCEGYDALEMDLLCRLREGEPKDQAQDRKFDNATAFRLLLSHREAVGKTKAKRSTEDEKAIIDRINTKLDVMREKMRKTENGKANTATAKDIDSAGNR